MCGNCCVISSCCCGRFTLRQGIIASAVYVFMASLIGIGLTVLQYDIARNDYSEKKNSTNCDSNKDKCQWISVDFSFEEMVYITWLCFYGLWVLSAILLAVGVQMACKVAKTVGQDRRLHPEDLQETFQKSGCLLNTFRLFTYFPTLIFFFGGLFAFLGLFSMNFLQLVQAVFHIVISLINIYVIICTKSFHKSSLYVPEPQHQTQIVMV